MGLCMEAAQSANRFFSAWRDQGSVAAPVVLKLLHAAASQLVVAFFSALQLAGHGPVQAIAVAGRSPLVFFGLFFGDFDGDGGAWLGRRLKGASSASPSSRRSCSRMALLARLLYLHMALHSGLILLAMAVYRS